MQPYREQEPSLNVQPDSAEIAGKSPGYSSLFSFVYFSARNSKVMEYYGTVGGVALELSWLYDDSCAWDYTTPILHPGRVLRGLIDENIRQSGNPEIEQLIQSGISVMKSVYLQDGKEKDVLAAFRSQLEDAAPSVSQAIVRQTRDPVTWVAMDPVRSEESARVLSNLFQGRDLILVALAHGATEAAMDMLLRYQSMTGNVSSLFYPLRLSMHKKEDRALRISDMEKQYLQQAAESRAIVIFEEDICGGKTHRLARNAAQDEIFPGREVTMVTNYDPNELPAINSFQGEVAS
jgi:hypothetical protein